jgi:hypothetical protein
VFVLEALQPEGGVVIPDREANLRLENLTALEHDLHELGELTCCLLGVILGETRLICLVVGNLYVTSNARTDTAKTTVIVI